MKRVQPLSSQRTAAPIAPAIRVRGSITLWSALMASGWVAMALLLFIPSLWLVPSFLASAIPGLYGSLVGWLPDWIASPRASGVGRAMPAFLYVLVMTGIWLAYMARTDALAQSDEEGGSRSRFAGILAGGVLFGALAVFWMGLFTSDPFLYAAQGKMQLLHGLNPIVQPPALMGDDALFELTPWKNIISAYGPVWLGFTWLAAMLGQAAGGSNLAYVLEFRAVNLLLMALATWLVWAIGGLLGWGQGRRAAATALFAWCPLLILELVGNAHNDAFLVVFLLAAIWLHLRGLWPLAIAALMCGGMVKVTGLFLLPAYLVLLARTSSNRSEAAKRLGTSIVVGAAVTAVSYAPYAHPDAISAFLSNPMKGYVTNSLATALREGLVDLGLALRGIVTPADLTWRQALEVVRLPIWWVPFAVWIVMALVFSLRARDFESLLRSWGWVLFSYMLLGAVWFQPWYATWLVPVLALLPATSRLRTAGLLLAYGCAISYSVIPHLPADVLNLASYYYIPAVIFLPTLLYCGAIAWRALRHREQAADLAGARKSAA